MQNVQLETASPLEIQSSGEGWEIKAGFAKSPFGVCLIGESPRGICHLSFLPSSKETALNLIRKDWPAAKINRNDAYAAKLAGRIFNRKLRPASLRALVKGSKFQVNVWKALLQIPSGERVSYGHLAKTVGKPSAARAVGSAVGKNPVAYLIPCHRVVRGTGDLGGYHWGPFRKRAILHSEKA